MSFPVQPATEPLGPDGRPTGELPSFETVQRGYHKGQVDELLRSLLHRLHTAEETLARGIQNVAGDVEKSPRARQLIDELMRLALDEILGQKAAAATEAEQLLADAHRQAAEVASIARDEADRLVAGAREQSETLLSSARAEASHHLDQAAAHAAAVSDAAGRRMQALASAHEQTLARFAEINAVTGQVLAAEGQRGSLQDEVSRALGNGPEVQATARGSLTASEAST